MGLGVCFWTRSGNLSMPLNLASERESRTSGLRWWKGTPPKLSSSSASSTSSLNLGTPSTGSRKVSTPTGSFRQAGDSGGPVVDARGLLVGVNSAVEYLVPLETAFFIESEANRPNVPRLMARIKRDRASRSR